MSAVVLKTIIVILFLAVVASLSSGLWFLLRDSSEQKRTMLALGVRVTLASLLLATVAYGILSGTLTFRPRGPGPIDCLQNVNEQEQSNPDHVNEVPVPAGRFKSEVIFLTEVTLAVTQPHDAQHDCTDANVQTVETGQHKEGRTIHARF